MSRTSDIDTLHRLYIDAGDRGMVVNSITDIPRNVNPLDYNHPRKLTNTCSRPLPSKDDMVYEIIQFGMLEDVHLYIFKCPECKKLFGLRQRITD